MPNDTSDLLTPRATIERGFALVRRGLAMAEGGAAEATHISDARTHLNAACVFIDAFLETAPAAEPAAFDGDGHPV